MRNKLKLSLIWLDAVWCTLFTLIIAGLFYLLFVNITFLDPFEKAFEDFSFTDLYYSKLKSEEAITPNIILVNVEHEDRFAIAQAIHIISLENPKAIGLDLLFKELKTPFTDSILKTELSQHKNLVTAYYHTDSSVVKNHPFFKSETEKSGYINFDQEESNVIRDFEGTDEEGNLSFVVQLAKVSGFIDSDEKLDKLEGRMPINYTGNSDQFLTVTISELLDLQEFPAAKDAVVIFGYLGTPTGNVNDIEDKHFTPLNPKFAGRSVPDMYGVVIHANILKMFMNKNFITKIPKSVVWILAILFCYVCCLISLKLEQKSEFLFDLLKKLLVFIVAVLFLYLALLLIKSNIHLDVSIILILTLLGVEMVEFYIYLMRYLKSKGIWKHTAIH